MSRCSCLLWGTGGIRKTQICLKFIEEMSSRLSHVFWVDASSVESIVMSLRGTSSISASQAPCLDDSIESILQWMSGIQEEWLIVFDNADEPPVHVVERFIPPETEVIFWSLAKSKQQHTFSSFSFFIVSISCHLSRMLDHLLHHPQAFFHMPLPTMNGPYGNEKNLLTCRKRCYADFWYLVSAIM